MLKYSNLALAQIQDLAAELATDLAGKKAVIGLVGNLGSGKTTFVKAFAKQLKINKISSPTFVITHQYPLGKRSLYHLDFYRLKNSKQLISLGLDEILAGPNLVLIEWVDKFPAFQRQCDILISLKVKPDNKRDVTIQNI